MKHDLKKPSPNLSQIKCFFTEKSKANDNSILIRNFTQRLTAQQ